MLDTKTYSPVMCTGRFEIVRTPSVTIVCGVCGKDSSGSQRRRFVEVLFRNTRLAADLPRVLCCMFCVARLFRQQSPRSLESVVCAMNRDDSRHRHANLLEMIERLGREFVECHDDVRYFVFLFKQGSAVIPPRIAARTATVLHAMVNDEDLRESFMWLHSTSASSLPPALLGLRPVFGGVGDVWPTLEQRTLVRSLRTAATNNPPTPTEQQ